MNLHGRHMQPREVDTHRGRDLSLREENATMSERECMLGHRSVSGCVRRHYASRCKSHHTSKVESGSLASFRGLRNCWFFLVGLKMVLTPRKPSSLPMRSALCHCSCLISADQDRFTNVLCSLALVLPCRKCYW